MKLIGVGGPRTGSSSLKAAFEILGYGNCYHMEWLFNNPEQVKYWVELFETGKTDHQTLFRGINSTSDFPGHLNYKYFLEHYPEANFVLVERDPELWYESSLKTVFEATPKTDEEKAKLRQKAEASPNFAKLAKVFGLVEKYYWDGFFEGKFLDKEFAIKKYLAHNEQVKRDIPQEKLLVYEIGSGWEPLCNFLNLPLPSEPFPFKNKRKEFKEQMGKMLDSGEGIKLV